MSTHPGGWGRCTASEVAVGSTYETRTEAGMVTARVAARLPATRRSRNERFLMVNTATGTILPRLKRAEDLRPMART